VNPAGELSVGVTWDGARILEATASLERPRAAELLRGRTAAEAVAWVPRLFALCGRAQAAAARAALGAAGERVEPGPRDEERVLVEAAQEHLWRLLRDWPRELGVEPREETFAAWHRRLATLSRDGLPEEGEPGFLRFVEEEVLGAGFGSLASRGDLEAWARGAPSLAAALVRPLLGEAPAARGAAAWLSPGAPLATLLAEPWAPGLDARPDRGGAPAETGALARWSRDPLVADLLHHGGRGLLPRLVARVKDLARAARRLAPFAGPPAIEACVPAPGVGLARVETARGALLHRVRVASGRILEYAVVAPTAWNFHPVGAFAQSCTGLCASSEDALRREVGRWVLAFDPCVPWRLRVSQAS
jgi:hypothetical protein